MKTLHLDGRRMTGNCHPYIKETLRLPKYYGENLDALYDCLCDMGNTEIIVEQAEQADPAFLEVLRDAAEENPLLQIKLLSC
ncbi:barstar family protein [bacterium 210820-DFI.6.37]|nr:barstar family protein [bacterium 210820-DFI.6.37]